MRMRTVQVTFRVEVLGDPELQLSPYSSKGEEQVELKVPEFMLESLDLSTIYTALLKSARAKCLQ